MPLIEYRCSECARVFERLVSRSEGVSAAECPTCRRPTGKRLVSLFQVRGDSGYSTTPGAMSDFPMASGGGDGDGCCGGSGCACGR